MSSRPIGYVMEQTLGNITHYLNLRSAATAAGTADLLWLPIEPRASRLPWTLSGGLLARNALSNVMPKVDGIFMHTVTLAPLCADLFRKKPTILSTDATLYNKREMRFAYGLKQQGLLAERSKRAIYGSVFRRAVAFVGWSNWVKQSFVEDYGCREQDVAVIPPGIDLNLFIAGVRNHELPRILFVGGDFKRKGGYALLDVYRKRLRGRAELVLVTREPVDAEPGVTVHRNVQTNSGELRELYATCDLCVLPTLADCYSLALMEALSAGMPVIATRVGGISDIVVDGKTGYLLRPGDSGALGDALEALVADASLRRRMGEAGRADALERFDARKNASRLFNFVRSHC